MKSLIIVLALVSFSSFANGKKSPLKLLKNIDKIEKKCPGLSISTEQKVDIKKAIADMKEAAKPLREDLKTARKAKRKVMMNPATTRAEAVTAMKEVRKTRRPLRKLRKSTVMDVQFEILTGEQRVKLLKCMKKRRGRN